MNTIDDSTRNYNSSINMLNNLESSYRNDPDLVNMPEHVRELCAKISEVRRRLLQERDWEVRITVYLSDSEDEKLDS